MNISLPHCDRQQALGEEIANSVSHGIGLVAAIVGTPFLILHAVALGNNGFLVGAIFFLATVFLLYLASTLYHAFPMGKTKRVFQVIEHSSIFLLVAGTYMPFTFGVLRGVWGWTLFGLVWGLALFGIALKIFNKGSHPFLSTGLYLLIGWVVVVALDPIIARVPTPGLVLLVAGGLSYTMGVVFFVTDSRIRYGHFIWHLFVMAGTVCHYFAVFWYAA